MKSEFTFAFANVAVIRKERKSADHLVSSPAMGLIITASQLMSLYPYIRRVLWSQDVASVR